MKFGIVLVCGLISIATGLELRGQDAKGDMEKLEGVWSVTAMERMGNLAPKAMTDNLLITFKAETMTMTRVKGGAKGKEYTFKLDPAKTPKAIDLMPTDGKTKGMTVRGIYQLDSTGLKLCISNTTENERPTEFKAPKDSDLIVLTLTPKK